MSIGWHSTATSKIIIGIFCSEYKNVSLNFEMLHVLLQMCAIILFLYICYPLTQLCIITKYFCMPQPSKLFGANGRSHYQHSQCVHRCWKVTGAGCDQSTSVSRQVGGIFCDATTHRSCEQPEGPCGSQRDLDEVGARFMSVFFFGINIIFLFVFAAFVRNSKIRCGLKVNCIHWNWTRASIGHRGWMWPTSCSCYMNEYWNDGTGFWRIYQISRK